LNEEDEEEVDEERYVHMERRKNGAKWSSGEDKRGLSSASSSSSSSSSKYECYEINERSFFFTGRLFSFDSFGRSSNQCVCGLVCITHT